MLVVETLYYVQHMKNVDIHIMHDNKDKSCQPDSKLFKQSAVTCKFL